MGTVLGEDPTKDKTLLPPFKILEREITDGSGNKRPIKIGFIGFVHPRLWCGTSSISTAK